MSIAPIIRILLRVFAGILIGYGFHEDAANMLWMDDQVVGLITWVLTEVFYWLAKKKGWAT